MHEYVLALFLGLFNGAEAPPAAQARPAMLVNAAAAAPAPDYSRAPVSAESAAAARRQVRYEKDGATHRFSFPDGTQVEFSDRSKRPRDQARRERVVSYIGTEAAAEEPGTTFEAAGRAHGLSPEAITARRFVSRHEGGFDAINTWDRARFSWGFIQFAGGRGFPPALAHFKARSPELFQTLLADYGIDVLPGEDGRPEPVYVDARSGRVLRGSAAEQAFGDNPLNIALFIRAGRVPEVKQRQVEAAIRDYAAPALTADYNGIPLSSVLRSPKGLAVLIDRKVHEGNVGRLEWALEHALIVSGARNTADLPRLEPQVLQLAVQDADARARIHELADTALAGIGRADAACGNGLAERVPDGPSLTSARAALEQAIYEADYRMVVGYRRDEQRAGLFAVQAALHPDRLHVLSPAEMDGELDRVAGALRSLTGRFTFEYAIRDRLRNIVNSDLSPVGSS
jgi:hypothetical protein